MTPSHFTRPLLVLTLLTGALLPTGCGVLAGPYFIPKVPVDDHRQTFDIDIVDPAGKPIPDATVTLVKVYEVFDAFNGTRLAQKREVIHSTLANPLSIDRAFYTSIDGTVEKPGYSIGTFNFHDGKFAGKIAISSTNGTPRGTVTLTPQATP
jgi:hypothetical protein